MVRLMSKNGNICKGIIEPSQQPQQLHRKDNQMIASVIETPAWLLPAVVKGAATAVNLGY